MAAASSAVNPKTAFPSTSLYVGDLAPDVNEALLFEIFNAVGPVASIRVCRDAVTRRSLGYAYVNFHNVGDAERALDTMNFSNIANRPCRIMWSQRDPALRKSGVGNIFVKNLDKSIDHKSLYDTFSVFGNILSCKVCTDLNGESLGYGFVHYQTSEAAEKAIHHVNGMSISGHRVHVAPFKPRAERTGDNSKFTNIYIKNLPETVDKNALEEMFGKVGTITSSMLAYEDGKFRGFAFVNYEKSEEAQEAIRQFHDVEFDGKKLWVGKAMKKAERQAQLFALHQDRLEAKRKLWEGRNLYVKNLSDAIDEEKLKEEFNNYGNVTSVKIVVDGSGRSRGFGFVCFETAEMASKAHQEMQNKMVDKKPLYVAFAQRREERRQMLEKQRRDNPMMPAMYPPAMYYQAPFPAAIPNPRWPVQGAPAVRGYPPMVSARVPRGARGGRGRGGVARGGRGGGRDVPVSTPAPVPMNFAQQLASAAPEQQKQMIGEKLFPLIKEVEQRRAGKITGMLLEMDNSDLLELLESKDALHEKIQEAITVLAAHENSAGHGN